MKLVSLILLPYVWGQSRNALGAVQDKGLDETENKLYGHVIIISVFSSRTFWQKKSPLTPARYYSINGCALLLIEFDNCFITIFISPYLSHCLIRSLKKAQCRIRSPERAGVKEIICTSYSRISRKPFMKAKWLRQVRHGTRSRNEMVLTMLQFYLYNLADNNFSAEQVFPSGCYCNFDSHGRGRPGRISLFFKHFVRKYSLIKPTQNF